MKQLDVQIMGQSYLLGCPEGGEARLLDAVEKVDAAMCKIRDAGKIKARDRIAVLAALNLAFELSEQEANALKATRNAAPAAARADTAGTAPADGAQPQLAALLQRLDNALGVDGRLL
ncbi:MAG: cell division protein ZapA [Pseudomonadota bacterium]|uniref:cell division protein ZapA n=1 Tax=Polaromonas sp. TaxID=1869339 RepID=UPI0017D17187|nr:cell division protein ZapA [Polaromonas sp.]MBA3593610.1 cell division protein ZapA [Polaromonas sp.]MDQ3273061.1 cell division protein ZapA [Pseudomonadota bacterium]